MGPPRRGLVNFPSRAVYTNLRTALVLSYCFDRVSVPVFQSVAGLFGGEGPVDFGCGGISVGLPNQGLFFELLGAANALVRALLGKGREFDFGPVEPGNACGGEVKRELVAQVTGQVQGQVFLKSAVTVGAVTVLHELDFLGVGVMGLHGLVQELGVVGLGSGRRDLQVALGRRTQHCLGRHQPSISQRLRVPNHPCQRLALPGQHPTTRPINLNSLLHLF